MPTVKINAQKFVVNPSDSRFYRHRYLLSFSSGAWVHLNLLVYANSLCSAVDACEDWLLEHAPGVFANDVVAEEYARALAAGASEEQAWEIATTDMTCFANSWVPSWEWGAVEDPTRDDLARVFNK